MNNIKKIVLIGPESTGKTTLARQLATHYNTVWVKEYARKYIDNLDRKYQQNDLLEIAKGQLLAEKEQVNYANRLLICDTDLIVIQVWSEVKYQYCDSWILEQIQHQSYDLYLLCGTDVPWEFDVQREHPQFREELFKIYESKLLKYNKKYVKIVGNKAIRLKNAIKYIDKLFL